LELRLEFRRYALPFRHAVRTAHGSWAAREGLFVRIERPDGTAGFGEAAPVPGFGPDTVDQAEEECRALGGTIDDAALARMEGASPALQNALSNALSDGTWAPRHTSLGVAALLPAGRQALAEAPPKAEAGFRVFKWKVGVGAPDDELAILDDLLGALPSGSRLRLDANGSWNRRTASHWLDRAADRPIEFVEQPVAPTAKGADDTLLGLASDYPVPLALDESLVADGDVARWLDLGWKGFFVVKPLLLRNPKAVLDRLEKAGARVVFSSCLETALGARASLRLAFAWPGGAEALGFGVWPLFMDHRFDGPTLAPFIAVADFERINPEALWSAVN
jgi:O-succinylbenzoate synthase